MIKLLAKLLSMVIIAVFSFFLGTKVGMNQYVMAMGSGNAFAISKELRLVRNGDIPSLICEMERRLNFEINLYSEYKKNGRAYLLWPYLHEIDHEQYMSSVQEYKEKYPQEACH